MSKGAFVKICAEHFIDMEGITYDCDEIPFDSLLADVWFYCVVVLSQRNVVLPVYDKIVTGNDTITLDTVSRGISVMVRMYVDMLSMFSCFVSTYRDICRSLEHDYDPALPSNSERLTELAQMHIEGQLVKFSAGQHKSRYNCPVHAQTYCPDEGYTSLDLSLYLPYAPLIVRLNLSGNGIAELPDDTFQRLPSLHHLDVSRNRLRRLPEGAAGARCLATLLASDNDIAELPAGLPASLATLDVSGCPLDGLPARVFALPALRTLVARSIMLAALPPDVADAASLVTLDVSEHQMALLPDVMSRLTGEEDVMYQCDLSPIWQLSLTLISPMATP
ncbi:PREDICTED: malignant fibrous histiocytoma-amplified sequence 1 homolog [Priapulus caudatus]|uniref:Malignant fibrous histiocytoma-amplified sequence 1 homolog n=1 Tax=Priapulus caudatus TaxID=37621 RepID=A0ABM1EVS3_PRICU|nr:PREDICTED: malignant fibrous histiocytoma-amplified sequence 1 homolog [Priapulus caudatus]